MIAPADVLDGEPVKLEDLVAGMGLGPRFTRHVKSLAQEETALAPCLEEDEFDNVTMSQMLNRKYHELFDRHRSSRAWGRDTLTALTALAEKFMERAGMLASGSFRRAFHAPVRRLQEERGPDAQTQSERPKGPKRGKR
jgi:hypothetical protein